jgi:hypothetical protein
MTRTATSTGKWLLVALLGLTLVGCGGPGGDARAVAFRLIENEPEEIFDRASMVVTETVFNWPGVGSLLIESIQRRDYPVVQGCVLLISLTYVVINLLTDLLYGWIDPRIRLERQ